MGKFNPRTPKPHLLWSNDEGLIQSILDEAGTMSREEMKQCTGKPLVNKYTDSKGVKRHVGDKSNLKASQHLALHLP